MPIGKVVIVGKFVITIGATEEWRRVGVCGECFDALGPQLAQRVACECVDAVVGDARCAFDHLAQTELGLLLMGLFRFENGIKAHNS